MSEHHEEDAEKIELHRLRAALRNANLQIAANQQEIQRLNEELASVRAKLEDSWEHLRMVRRSLSWRLTAPLRLGTRGDR